METKKEKTISNLYLLRTLLDNDVIPTMEYDGKREDKMKEIDQCIEYLKNK